MPLQNRVLATGEIVAHPARGLMMGNRGILHAEGRTLTKARWRHKNWVCCVLEFKGRHRQVMTVGTYTELFFLDEAVAFAAGHRPCAECRRADYLHYLDAIGHSGKAKALDDKLHAERAIPRKFAQRREQADMSGLPSGTIILSDAGPILVQRDHVRAIGAAGYGPALPRPTGIACVLTPATSREALRNGYAPVMHPTAEND